MWGTLTTRQARPTRLYFTFKYFTREEQGQKRGGTSKYNSFTVQRCMCQNTRRLRRNTTTRGYTTRSKKKAKYRTSKALKATSNSRQEGTLYRRANIYRQANTTISKSLPTCFKRPKRNKTTLCLPLPRKAITKDSST